MLLRGALKPTTRWGRRVHNVTITDSAMVAPFESLTRGQDGIGVYAFTLDLAASLCEEVTQKPKVTLEGDFNSWCLSWIPALYKKPRSMSIRHFGCLDCVFLSYFSQVVCKNRVRCTGVNQIQMFYLTRS